MTIEEGLKRYSTDDDDHFEQPLLEIEHHKSRDLQRTAVKHFLASLSKILTIVFFSLSLVIFTITIFRGDLDRTCLKRMHGWSPLLDILDYNYESLDPEAPSVYIGEWTSESIEAWHEKYHHYGSTGISDDKLPLLNKSLSTQWERHAADSTRFAGQIKAKFEGLHRLHCVYLTRMYAFRDMYDFSNTSDFKGAAEDRLRRHVEHCIDNMRWGIHCNADITPYLFERHIGKDGKSQPRLSLKRQAKCLDFDRMVDYVDETTVH